MEASFSLSAQPNTDIWKKAPSIDIFNAPYKPHTTAPLSHFRSATISFSSSYTTQFDQAGILLILTSPSSPSRKWIKAGVEFFADSPRASVVCCDRYADWSVADIPSRPGFPSEGDVVSGKRFVTVTVEKQASDNGAALWIYLVGQDGQKIPLREIAWVFEEPDKWELQVCAAVARPAKDVDGQLEAKFKDFDVKWVTE